MKSPFRTILAWLFVLSLLGALSPILVGIIFIAGLTFLGWKVLGQLGYVSAPSLPDRTDQAGQDRPLRPLGGKRFTKALREIDQQFIAEQMCKQIDGQDYLIQQFVDSLTAHFSKNRNSGPYTALIGGERLSGKSALARALRSALNTALSHTGHSFGYLHVSCSRDEALEWPNLIDSLKESDGTILHLDDIENALPDNAQKNAFLNGLEQLIKTRGLRDTVVVMTTRLMSDEISRTVAEKAESPSASSRQIRDILAQKIDAGFLEQIRLVSGMQPLDDLTRASIAWRILVDICERDYGLILERPQGREDENNVQEFLKDSVRAWRSAGSLGIHEVRRWLEAHVAKEIVLAKKAGTAAIYLQWDPIEKALSVRRLGKSK